MPMMSMRWPAMLAFGAAALAAPCAQAVTVCTVGATPIVFANYSITAGLLQVNGLITVTCTAATGPLAKVNYSIALGVSQKSGTMVRQMNNLVPAGVLKYNLYTDTNAVWGDNTSGTAVVTGSVTPVSIGVPAIATHIVFGRIPASQNASAGLLYGDSINVTLTY